MAPSRIRITGTRTTPVAFVDPPLLNTVGVHQPYALRAIIQLGTDAGLVGLGETYADEAHLARLRAAADAIAGLDVFALNSIRAAIADRLSGDSRAVGTAGMITTASAVDQFLSPFEVACLDVQGHATGRPVSDLLGGAVRGGLYGTAPSLSPGHPTLENNSGDVRYETDFRSVYARLLEQWLGVSSAPILGGDFRAGAPAIF